MAPRRIDGGARHAPPRLDRPQGALTNSRSSQPHLCVAHLRGPAKSNEPLGRLGSQNAALSVTPPPHTCEARRDRQHGDRGILSLTYEPCYSSSDECPNRSNGMSFQEGRHPSEDLQSTMLESTLAAWGILGDVATTHERTRGCVFGNFILGHSNYYGRRR